MIPTALVPPPRPFRVSRLRSSHDDSCGPRLGHISGNPVLIVRCIFDLEDPSNLRVPFGDSGIHPRFDFIEHPGTSRDSNFNLLWKISILDLLVDEGSFTPGECHHFGETYEFFIRHFIPFKCPPVIRPHDPNSAAFGWSAAHTRRSIPTNRGDVIAKLLLGTTCSDPPVGVGFRFSLLLRL